MGLLDTKSEKKKKKKGKGATGTQTCNPQRDGTYSWTQPGSTGFQGWEGYCGQTCVANLVTTCTPNQVSPKSVIDIAHDWTPGSKPETLLTALNKLSGAHRKFSLSYASSALANATAKRPIGCLLQWGEGSMHWVMVVRVTPTHVYFNHWGEQASLSRTEFDNRWGFKNQSTGDGIVSFLGGLKPYTSMR